MLSCAVFIDGGYPCAARHPFASPLKPAFRELTDIFVSSFPFAAHIHAVSNAEEMPPLNDHYPFKPMPLPYSREALEPAIDARTLYYHYEKHYKGYVDNLNKALAPYPEYHRVPLIQLLADVESLPWELQTSVRNQGGGVYNHELYFSGMTPRSGRRPAVLEDALRRGFGSYDQWKSTMKETALSVFGSGYAFLCAGAGGTMKIVKTANQDTVTEMTPLLALDVWEHAYYLLYQNKREEYVENWFSLCDWQWAAARYRACCGKGTG